jgi:TonB family protein
MTLTVKDSPADSSLGKPSSSTQNSENSSNPSPRSNPVCLEVPVVIRSLPGEHASASGPTREEGRTVIVFDNGAVLRISRQLPPGQTVILSNQQGRDVVCRVMGGRNLPNKGYVEIEFIEQVDDFWRIHQTSASTSTPASSPIPAPSVAAQATPQTIPVDPSLAAPPRADLVSAQEAAPDRATNVSSGRAPTFEDVEDLVRMSRPVVTSQDSKEKKQDKRIDAAASTLKSKSELAGNLRETGKSVSSASSTKVTPLISELPSEKPAIPPVRETVSAAARKPSQPDVLAGKGVLASPYSAQASSTGESRKPMPLIIGGAALVLVGFGAGYFLMHRGTSPKAPPQVAVVSESSAPASPLTSVTPESASQLPVNQAPPQTQAQSQMQAPPQTIQPISAPALAATESSALEATDSQDARSSAKAPVVTKPDRPQAHRPTISNLQMKSPAAPNQSQAKVADGSSISAADLTPTVAAAGGALLSSVMGAQPAPPSGIPTAPVGKTVREPQLISSTHAVYPPFAKQSNVQGKVVVTATVDAKGDVVNANAVSGPPFLRQAATDAVKQWKYSPALIDGRPASAQVTVSLDFRLN